MTYRNDLLAVLENDWRAAKEKERETDVHPCDAWWPSSCMCKGSCSCHWAKVAPEHARAVNAVKEATQTFYWICFSSDIGGSAHSFLEFNGLMRVYSQLLENAVRAGIDPQQLNEHCGVPLPVEGHEIKYLAEKLRCIFGPVLASNPTARAILLKELFQIVE
jgi:hypothetical protein